jgi:amino acid adenylation domain
MRNTKVNVKMEKTMVERRLYNLTNAQKQIFEMSSCFGENTTSISVVLWMKEKYEENILQETVDELIRRNDAFRIKIVNDNGTIKQYQESRHPYVVSTLIFDTKSDYERWIINMSSQGLDIQGELYQIVGCCVEGRFGVYIKMHHIICDGWSMHIVCKEFDEIYHAYMQGEMVKYTSGSYFECIAKEEDYFSSEKMMKDKEYWRKIFEKRNSLVTLSDRMAISNLAERAEHYIELDTMEQIRNYCKASKCSVYEFFATVLAIYLGKISGEKNFFIGTTFVERSKSKDVIGMFVHSIPLFLELNGTNFGNNISMVKNAIFYAFKHQKYNYTCMASDFGVKNLYDIKLNYQIVTKRGEEYYKRSEWVFQQAQNESLIINLMDEIDGRIKVIYDYRVSQYRKEEIGILHQHIQKMIKDILQKKEEISYLDEKEKLLVKTVFNNTEKNYSLEKNVIDIFEEQVKNMPEQMAIICREQKLSYSQLNKRINILAHELVKKGIKAGDFVAIITERSIEMMIGIYAVLKAGGAYIPICPDYPNSRIQYILADAKPKIALVYKAEFQADIATIDLEDFIWLGNEKNPKINRNMTDTAYCIFTSGTTGKPKGVMITHRNLMNYIFYALSSYFNDENKVIPLFTNYGFDLTVTTIFGGWLSGATLEVLSAENEENISNIFRSKDYTFAKMTPTHLHIATTEKENMNCQIKHLVIGGEELDVVTSDKILQKYGSKIKIHNEYGPTEATVGCCDYVYDPNHAISSSVLIGKPIANTQIYILKGMELCGICIPGELCVAGAGIAKGYLNRKELTDEKFIKNPFGEGRLYRTGDLARWLPDGNLEYLGRIDEQVKIRGFRIEIGEIESAIRELSEIHDCVVCVKRDMYNEKILCAYLVSQEGKLDVSNIRCCLQGKLPEYMIPSLLMQIETIPMTLNGKVDRNCLPEIKIEKKKDYIAPQSENEKLVSEIFVEVLGIEDAGKKDNFFELGGHSLRATKLVNRIEARTGCRISVREIFVLSTVEEIAKVLDAHNKEIYQKIPKAEKKEYYTTSSSQKRIYLSSQMDATGVAYNMPFAIKLIG